jgi:hypothetical protein
MLEINEIFGLNLDSDPCVERLAVPAAGTGGSRVYILGASHMRRLAATLLQKNLEVKDLSSPGWTPSPESIRSVAAYLREQVPTTSDTLVVDIWSNSACMGTDEIGTPCRAQRGSTDGKFHICGQLQAAPKTIFKHLLQETLPVIGAAGGASIILVAPFPRYVMRKCCDSEAHITNWGTAGFFDELRETVVLSKSAVAAAGMDGKCTVIDLLDVLGGADAPLDGLMTAEGRRVWQDTDPVHLTEDGYAAVADYIADLAAAENGPGPSKRPRLTSVVPGVAAAGHGHRGNVRPSLWVAGEAERGRGRGARSRGGPAGPGRGSAFIRGSYVSGRFPQRGGPAGRRSFRGRRFF